MPMAVIGHLVSEAESIYFQGVIVSLNMTLITLKKAHRGCRTGYQDECC